jgi:hypothetical protein
MTNGVLAFARMNFWAWLKNLAYQDIAILTLADAPTDGTSGTAAGKAGPGCLLIDTNNKILYINTGTKASPTWTKVGTQS